MGIELSTLFMCIAIGMATGVVAGLCGVGGGIIMVPAFAYFFKMDQKTAVATSLAAVILTSVTASIKNHGNNLVDWKITICTGLVGALLAWFAADWLKQMSNLTLTRLFAILIIVIGVRMLWTAR